jgi:hypothetical protein
MKTTCITHAPARNIYILILLVYLQAAPALSQVNYTSSYKTLFTGLNKEFTVNIVDYYSTTDPVMRQINFASTATDKLYSVKNEKTEMETDLSDKSVLNSGSFLKENKNVNSNENPEISFKTTSFTYPKNAKVDIGIEQYSEAQLILYAKSLREYARNNGFDTSYAFFTNMGILCSKKRFFVVNLVTMKIEHASLVSHGRGQGISIFDKQYSDQSGSRCTSLGRYKIMAKYKGAYGESYRMVGLDSTNANAYNRNIVLHSMSCIPDAEKNWPACVSDGCPAVSVKFLTTLSNIIDAAKKPVLLWIFDSNLEEVLVKEKTESIKTRPVTEVSDDTDSITLLMPDK